MISPYAQAPPSSWPQITSQLIENHPLSSDEIVNIVLDSWDYIKDTRLGHKFTIGVDIKPKPQIMGFFLHELIALEVAARYPDAWRPEKIGSDKDVVCLTDDKFSIEIKTSSDKRHVFGNRSYAQAGIAGKGKKAKAGYYLTVNFEKFSNDGENPRILLIRFGWLDHEDWIGQSSATGQQSRLSKDADQGKLQILYTAE